MKIAIMQPYLFPYMGYFQLINAVDKFIIYDDIQFMKNGWINRNYILLNDKKHLFTLSVKKDSYKLNINQRFFSNQNKEERINLIKTIDLSYRKAPYYNQKVKKLIYECLNYEQSNISLMLDHTLDLICDYLKIKTPLMLSSLINDDKNLKGQKRVINIVNNLGGDHYINNIGGRELYSKKIFTENKIKLNFLQPKKIKYKQFNDSFVPNLSIIDVLMFNSKKKIKEILNQYILI